MTNSLSTIPINRLNSNELTEKINTSVEEKANIDLSNTPFANLENVDGTLTWDGNEVLASNTISSTELGYLDGVTSNIQTQLNGKQASGSYTNTSASNFNTTGKSTIADLGMPDYTAGIGYAGNTWIKAPYDCYVIGGLQEGSSKETQIHVNANATESNYVVLRRIYGYANIQGAFIRKGFYFRLYCNGITYNTMYFPLMGVK